MHRLFVGLRPPPAIRALLLDLMGGVPGARWQSDEQLHVTLRFIGAVERPVAEDVAVALASLHAQPIEVALSGVGQFDTRGRAHALWAGLTPHAPLADLHRKVDQALVRCGLDPERRAYRPHITLARMKPGTAITDGFLQDHAALSSAPFALDHFLLFESHLGHDAASYEAVERYPLRG
ncbi:RNA 2',3'-cyclic phosphodiesterase [Sphingomonas sp. S2-65]|uniref:RNA 2',3'-cyclic phosphodiesterase n=1 Tax=Sphingomonas sp. S2-65 TaxID=2903960 RepID=UPI001F3B8D87|nr:RNA 2',3'-cyclic phosphodiesterase [Sphingomonas sp. S2-65]UYY60006.1 RNA 2',3'-cyclic phosphodiesterase [Sphingomonas sp. S2-65]